MMKVPAIPLLFLLFCMACKSQPAPTTNSGGVIHKSLVKRISDTAFKTMKYMADEKNTLQG